MRKRNLITLDTGLNEIDISYKDFGISSSKFPIAHLPAGKEIHNVSFTVIDKFRSSTIDNQTNPESCIKNSMMVGTEDDSHNFLSWTQDISNKFGRLTTNSGVYFSNPISYNIDTMVVIENWISPRVWTIGGDLSVARQSLGGCGSQTAGLSFGGYTGSNSNKTEEYNGTAWSGGGNMLIAKYSFAGCGTQDAGLHFGGNGALTGTEKYNGATWTTSGSLNTSRRHHAGCGTQTAGLGFGGDSSGLTLTAEEFNGSTWTYGNNMNIARDYLSGFGLQTSGVAVGGDDSVLTTYESCEEYNGATWSITNSLNIARSRLASSGLSNSGLTYSGYSGNVAYDTTEETDGISWYVVNSLNYDTIAPAGCGSKSNSLIFGGAGIDNVYHNYTQEYSQVDLSKITRSGKLKLSLTVI